MYKIDMSLDCNIPILFTCEHSIKVNVRQNSPMICFTASTLPLAQASSWLFDSFSPIAEQQGPSTHPQRRQVSVPRKHPGRSFQQARPGQFESNHSLYSMCQPRTNLQTTALALSGDKLTQTASLQSARTHSVPYPLLPSPLPSALLAEHRPRP